MLIKDKLIYVKLVIKNKLIYMSETDRPPYMNSQTEVTTAVVSRPTNSSSPVSTCSSTVAEEASDVLKAITTPPVVHYEKVKLSDMFYDQDTDTYYYSCPCGDLFEISAFGLLKKGDRVASCPSCSLTIEVLV